MRTRSSRATGDITRDEKAIGARSHRALIALRGRRRGVTGRAFGLHCRGRSTASRLHDKERRPRPGERIGGRYNDGACEFAPADNGCERRDIGARFSRQWAAREIHFVAARARVRSARRQGLCTKSGI